MAYGKYFDESKFQIDFSRYIPVSVMVTFNPLGEMRPDMIQLVIHDESKKTFKIHGIKSHKNVSDGIKYVCLINLFGYMKEINLTFFVLQKLWCIEK